MSLENRRKGVLALGKQASVGTAQSTISFAAPVLGGTLGALREYDDIAVTSSNNSRRGRYVKTAYGSGTVRLLAHPEMLGFLLYHAMGAKAVTGAGPYTHTFTMADALPTLPITAYFLVGDSWERLIDAFISRLAISGESGGNLEVEVEFMSYSAEEPVSAPSYSLADIDPRFKFIGTTFQAEADSGTPAAMTNVDSFEFEIVRELELHYGTSLTPVSHIPSRDVNFSMGLVYDTAQQGWDFYRAASKGAAAGGTPVQAMVKGSVDMSVGFHPSSTTSRLQIESGTGVAGSAQQVWEYEVERPEPDPGGGKITMDVAGGFYGTQAGATEATLTLINSTASYTT